MNPLGRAAVLVLCSVLLAACGDQTSSGSAADDPTTTRARPSPRDDRFHARRRSHRAPSAPPSPACSRSRAWRPGAPPSVPYLTVTDAGCVAGRPGGETQPLPRAYDAFAPMGDGLVGTASVDDVTQVVRPRRRPRGGLAGGEPERLARGHAGRRDRGLADHRGQPARRGARRQPGVEPAGRGRGRLARGAGQRRRHLQGGRRRERVRGLRELRRGHERPVGDLPRHRRHHAGRPGCR